MRGYEDVEVEVVRTRFIHALDRLLSCHERAPAPAPSASPRPSSSNNPTDELVTQTRAACAAALAAVSKLQGSRQQQAPPAASFPAAPFMQVRYPTAVQIMSERRALSGAPRLERSDPRTRAAGVSSSTPDAPETRRAAGPMHTEYAAAYRWPDDRINESGDQVATLLTRIAALSEKLPRDLRAVASPPSEQLPLAAQAGARRLAEEREHAAAAEAKLHLAQQQPSPPPSPPPPPPAAAQYETPQPPSPRVKKRRTVTTRRAPVRVDLQRFPPAEHSFGGRTTTEARDSFRRYSQREMRLTRGSTAARMLIAKRRWAAQISSG